MKQALLLMLITIHALIPKVLLDNGWNSKQMIMEGEAAIPLGTTLHAFRNQEITKQRSTIANKVFAYSTIVFKANVREQ